MREDPSLPGHNRQLADSLWIGKKPTLRTLEMLQFYFMGWATEEELQAHIAQLKDQV